MSISIIIPVYNKVENLRACLYALINQEFKEFEVIISDDGSSENIPLKIDDIVKKSDFKIKYIKQEDIGFRAGQARNNAVRKSEGKYLLFVDQDIIFGRDFTLKVMNALKETQVVIYRSIQTSSIEKINILNLLYKQEDFSSFFMELNKNKILEIEKMIKDDKYRTLKYNFKLRKKGADTLGLFGIKKELFYNINGFDEEFSGYGYEDIEISNRIYRNKYKSKVLELKTIHLYHDSLANKNIKQLEYNKKLVKEKEGQKRCFYGLANRKDKDEIIYLELN